MKIRSRGLGRRELLMDLREFSVDREGAGIVLKGVTHAPITWETTISVGPEDVGAILRMVFKASVLRLGLRWAMRRKGDPASEEAAEPATYSRRRGTAALPAETVVATLASSTGQRTHDSTAASNADEKRTAETNDAGAGAAVPPKAMAAGG